MVRYAIYSSTISYAIFVFDSLPSVYFIGVTVGAYFSKGQQRQDGTHFLGDDCSLLRNSECSLDVSSIRCRLTFR